jgi:predicted RNase H-like nuclease
MRYFDFLDDAQLATVHGASPECGICYVSPEPPSSNSGIRVQLQ